MDDSEAVAAVGSGDPTGLAALYERYAPALYGYCRWMLPEPARAADALLETFVTAAAALGGLKDASRARAWLYAAARKASRSRTEAAGTGLDEIADEAGPPADAGLAEMRRLIRATLAEFDPLEREVIELSIRHHLDPTELATVLEVSWSRAQAMASRAREHLEDVLAALVVASTWQQSCPDLATLLAGWDGRLTVQTASLTVRHLELCDRCAQRRLGSLRPEVLASALPLAALPAELREPILAQAISRRDEAAARPRSGDSRQSRKPVRWTRIRENPGPATAAAAVTIWAVAAVIATLITVTGPNAGHAAARTSAATPAQSSSTAPAATPTAVATVP